MLKNICFIFGLSLITSCTTQLKYSMYNHKFLTPETKGEFLSGDVSLSYQSTQKVVVAEAFDALVFNSSVTNTNTSVSRSSSLDLPINLGLLHRLDFFTLDSKYGLKFQFYGSPESEKAEGHKAALAMAYGYDHKDGADVTYSSGSSSRTYSTDMKLKSYEVSLLYGYRLSEKNLVYLNIFRDNYKYNGTLTSNQFATIIASGKSYNQGVILGFQITHGSQKTHFMNKLEAGVAEAKIDNRNSRSVGTMGASIGWSW